MCAYLAIVLYSNSNSTQYYAFSYYYYYYHYHACIRKLRGRVACMYNIYIILDMLILDNISLVAVSLVLVISKDYSYIYSTIRSYST